MILAPRSRGFSFFPHHGTYRWGGGLYNHLISVRLVERRDAYATVYAIDSITIIGNS